MLTEQIADFLQGYMQPVYGYCLRRCASPQDAEDAAQEILLRTYAGLQQPSAVSDPERYLWTVARNTIASQYRARARCTVGLPPEMADDTDIQAGLSRQDDLRRLHDGVARLSRQQREIVVLHYFHGMKQADVAAALSLPAGTVKWHLHEAKKELKHHMETHHPAAHLKFDPVRFTGFATEGSFGGDGSPWRYFRTALHQNIAYACWHEPRTAAQIADALGMSPVYLQDELDYMTDQCYLTLHGGQYRCGILITETTDRLTDLSDRMYREAAVLIAPDLLQSLQSSDLWDSIISAGHADRDYALWALIPWCIASSADGSALSFASVATLRPDGARNIIHATITPPGVRTPALYQQMNADFSGPCWNELDGLTLWQMDSSYSERRIGEIYQHEAHATLSRLRSVFEGLPLSEEEYAALAKEGLVQCAGEPDGLFRATLLPVWVKGKAARERLLHTTNVVYARHRDALEALRRPYADALLKDTPPHLRAQRQYLLQSVFHSGWFILHCLKHLADEGLLREPAEDEKRSLHTLLLTD